MLLVIESVGDLAAAVLFISLLLAACWSDVASRRVPNALVLLLAVGGIVYSISAGGWIDGLASGLGGLILGLLIWLPSWLVRLLGAGDVKLFAAAGAWLGPRSTLEAAVWAGLIGGLLSIVYLLRHRGIRGAVFSLSALRLDPKGAIQRERVDPARKSLPYSVALAGGAVIAAWFPRTIF